MYITELYKNNTPYTYHFLFGDFCLKSCLKPTHCNLLSVDKKNFPHSQNIFY